MLHIRYSVHRMVTILYRMIHSYTTRSASHTAVGYPSRNQELPVEPFYMETREETILPVLGILGILYTMIAVAYLPVILQFKQRLLE